MSARAPVAIAIASAIALTLAPSHGAAELGVDALTPGRVGAARVIEPEESPSDAPRERTRWSLVAPGIGLLAGGWLSNVGASLPAGLCAPAIVTTPGGRGCSADPGWDGFRLVGLLPVVGPLAQLGLKPGSLGQDGWALWLVADAAMQLAGVVVLAVGLLDPVRSPAREEPTVRLVPLIGPNTAGVSLDGRF